MRYVTEDELVADFDYYLAAVRYNRSTYIVLLNGGGRMLFSPVGNRRRRPWRFRLKVLSLLLT